MALEKAVGVLVAPASGQLLHVLPFVPKFVRFFAIESGTEDAFIANASISIGWVVSTGAGNQFAIGVRGDDAASTNQAKPRFQNDACVLMINDANPGVVQLEANLFETFQVTNGGFKLDFPTSIAGIKIGFVAIGGSDIANVSTLSFSQGGVTGNVSFTGAGFPPDYFEFLSDGKATSFPGTGGKGINFGVAVSATKRFGISCLFKAQVNKAGKAGGHLLDTRCIVASKGPASIESESDFVSFDADGGTVNVVTAKSNFLVAVLCVEFSADGAADCGVDTEPATAAIKATTTSIDPQVLLVASLNDPSTAGVTDAKMSFGASDGSTRRCIYAGNLDNPPTDTKADSRQASAKLLIQATPGAAPTLDGEATETFGTLKFDTDWSSVSGNQNRFAWAVMKGAAPAGGRTVNCTTEALLLQTIAAAVNASRGVSGATESLQLSTLNATVNRSRLVAGVTESLQLVPSVASVNRSRLVSAISEALQLTANAATVIRGGGRLVTCVTEALLLSVNLASVNRSRLVTGLTESLQLATVPASTARSRGIQGIVEILDLAANQAAVNRSRQVNGSTEILNLVTSSALVNRSRIIAALTEALRLSTNPATVTTGGARTVNCLTEALLLSVNISSVGRSRGVQGVAESLLLATNLAAVNASRSVQALSEAILLTEHSAAVNRSRIVGSLTEVLELTANPATVSGSRAAACVTEALQLATQQGSVSRSRIVSALTEALQLTVNSATVIAIAAAKFIDYRFVKQSLPLTYRQTMAETPGTKLSPAQTDRSVTAESPDTLVKRSTDVVQEAD